MDTRSKGIPRGRITTDVEGVEGRQRGRDKADKEYGPSFNSVCIANRWSIRVSTANDTVDTGHSSSTT